MKDFKERKAEAAKKWAKNHPETVRANREKWQKRFRQKVREQEDGKTEYLLNWQREIERINEQ